MQSDLIPHIQQFDGPWAIYPPSAERFTSVLRGMDWAQHFRETQSRIDSGDHAYSGEGYEVAEGGVAVVDLEGVLSKYGSSMSRGGSTVRFRQVLRRVHSAYDAGRVKACMVVFESGGGTTMGTPEAAAEVASLSAAMPVWSYIEDLGASACYWIASQAEKVVCNESALVGSIGTYMAVYDTSKMLSKDGVDALLFRGKTWKGKDAAFKGAGTFGTEVTEEQRAEFDSLASRINKPFLHAVHDARGLTDDQMEAVSDGRVWRGQEAVDMGLVDAVMTYENALAELAGDLTPTGNSTMAKPRASTKTTPESTRTKAKSEDMKDEEDTSAEDDEVEETESEEEEEDKATESKAKWDFNSPKSKSKAPATTIAAIRAAVPDADSDFLLNAYESGMTPADAKSAWMEQTIKAQQAQIDELKSQRPGVAPLGRGKSPKSSGGLDHVAAIRAEVKALTDEGIPRHKATAKVLADNPEYREAMVASANAV